MTGQTNKSEAEVLQLCESHVKNNTQQEHGPHYAVTGNMSLVQWQVN